MACTENRIRNAECTIRSPRPRARRRAGYLRRARARRGGVLRVRVLARARVVRTTPTPQRRSYLPSRLTPVPRFASPAAELTAQLPESAPPLSCACTDACSPQFFITVFREHAAPGRWYGPIKCHHATTPCLLFALSRSPQLSGLYATETIWDYARAAVYSDVRAVCESRRGISPSAEITTSPWSARA